MTAEFGDGNTKYDVWIVVVFILGVITMITMWFMGIPC